MLKTLAKKMQRLQGIAILWMEEGRVGMYLPWRRRSALRMQNYALIGQRRSRDVKAALWMGVGVSAAKREQIGNSKQ